MEDNTIEVNFELQELEKERASYEYELEMHKEKLKQSLLGDMGKDIDDVLSGNKIVELPQKEKIKYKIKHFFESIFNLF
jgi:hypothetical protein